MATQSKQEIKREYRERKPVAGVFVVRNSVNGKIFLGSSLNLNGPLNAHKFMLTTHSHRNKALQHDWDEFGAGAFAFEILEEVTPTDNPNFNIDDELTLLEQIWIETLQPFGDKGYNTERKIRQA